MSREPTNSANFSLEKEDTSLDRHIIDLLIEERAARLMSSPRLWRALKTALYPLLRYKDAVAMADRYQNLDGREIFEDLARDLDLRLTIHGADNVPRQGSAILVSNHPTGIADGIAVYGALKSARPDLSFLANRDALRVAPGLIDMLIPTEWVAAKRTLAKTRVMMKHTKLAMDQGRLVGIFPSGRLAKLTRSGLVEQPWLSSTIGFMRRFNVPILPLHISARNSAAFYLLSLLHPELRDITLFNELLNKRHTKYDLTFGPPIAPQELDGNPRKAIENLRTYIENDLKTGTSFEHRFDNNQNNHGEEK